MRYRGRKIDEWKLYQESVKVDIPCSYEESMCNLIDRCSEDNRRIRVGKLMRIVAVIVLIITIPSIVFICKPKERELDIDADKIVLDLCNRMIISRDKVECENKGEDENSEEITIYKDSSVEIIID